MHAKQPEKLNSQEVPIILIHMPSSQRLLITLIHVRQAAMNAEQQKLSITKESSIISPTLPIT